MCISYELDPWLGLPPQQIAMLQQTRPDLTNSYDQH